MRSSSFQSSLLILLGLLLSSCVEELPTDVYFDQTLESVTFENRLFTPIVVFQDGAILDTIPAEQNRTYALNRKGAVRHAWKIVPPRGFSGSGVGIEPYVDLGVQYQINANYKITHNSVPGEVIFTPRIANFSPYDLLLLVNYREEDEFITDYVIPRNGITSVDHAPYFYWNTYSNVSLPMSGGFVYREYRRQDSGEYGLSLDNSVRFGDAGATNPITVQ